MTSRKNHLQFKKIEMKKVRPNKVIAVEVLHSPSESASLGPGVVRVAHARDPLL